MRKYISLLLSMALLISMPTIYSAGTVDGTTQNAVKTSSTYSIAKQTLEQSTRVNILFDGQVDYELLKKYQTDIIHTYQSIPAVTVEIDPNVIDKLLQEPQIKDLQKDQLAQVQSQSIGWAHDRMNLGKRVPIDTTGKGIKIAVVDTGIDYEHPDLKIAGGKCVLDSLFLDNPCLNSYKDDNGHGTHVAGIIAAQNNDYGVLGTAPDALIYGVKALDSQGYGTTSSILAGLDWAIQNKMDIINLSLTTPDNDPLMEQLIKKAYNQGILVVAAAGNEDHITGREENVLYPAKYSEVIGVSALGKTNNLIPTSSVGKEIELTAPGGSILSTVPVAFDTYGTKDGYGMMSGTSMAAPHVSAMAALYMEKFPMLNHVQIRELLRTNSLDLGSKGRDTKFGYGVIQADVTAEVTTSVTVGAKSNGTVNIEITKLPKDSSSYNLYRFDKKIISNGTDVKIEDFGGKGFVQYKLVPLINGKEVQSQSKHFSVQLASPALKDMNNQYWFSRNVMYLHREKVMSGYATGYMKPFQTITRVEAVVMLVNSLGFEPNPSVKVFKDVKPTSFGAGHVGVAVKKGILNGFADGTFRGGQQVTRAEMSIMLSKAFNLPKSTTPNPYKDVNKSIAGYDEIRNVSSSKIAQGYADGTFKPQDKMTRATYAVFLSKAKNEKLK